VYLGVLYAFNDNSITYKRKKVVFTFKKMYACILGKFWDMFDNCFEKYFFYLV